jgi:hypothetical protein
MEWLDASLEQYKAVWQEKMASMNTQQSNLQIATAIIGAIFVAGLNLWDKPVVSEFILLFIVPVVSYLFLVIWMGELQRMVRATKFLAAFENSLNEALSNAPIRLSFENWILQKKGRDYPNILKWNYRAILITFQLIAAASVAVGLYKFSMTASFTYVWLILGFEIIPAIFILIYYMFTVNKFYIGFEEMNISSRPKSI